MAEDRVAAVGQAQRGEQVVRELVATAHLIFQEIRSQRFASPTGAGFQMQQATAAESPNLGFNNRQLHKTLKHIQELKARYLGLYKELFTIVTRLSNENLIQSASWEKTTQQTEKVKEERDEKEQVNDEDVPSQQEDMRWQDLEILREQRDDLRKEVLQKNQVMRELIHRLRQLQFHINTMEASFD
ncbi:hypothetical protein QOT17_009617 [Balamuthia mandrillaris]